MSDTWATSGLDLHLDRLGPRVRAGLEARCARRCGPVGWRPGTRLPSSRALAADLGIARNTVAEAYAQLVAEGWLTARQGSGTRVADRRARGGRGHRRRRPRRPRPPALRPAPGLARPLGLPPRRLARRRPPGAGRGAQRGASATATRAAGPSCARRWPTTSARARGVRADPDLIVVCSGFAQGLGLLRQVLRARGATHARRRGVGLRPHRARRRGQRAGRRARCRSTRAAPGSASSAPAAAVLLTPAHQFPIGVRAAPRAPHRGHRLGGRDRRPGDRGRLRRRVPLRPPAGRRPAGARPRPRRLRRHRQQEPRPRACGWAGWCCRPAWSTRCSRPRDWPTAARAALDQLTLAEFIASGALRPACPALAAAPTGGGATGWSPRWRTARPRRASPGIAAGLHALVELPAGQHRGWTLVARAAAAAAWPWRASAATRPPRPPIRPPSGGRLRHPARARLHRRSRAPHRHPR